MLSFYSALNVTSKSTPPFPRHREHVRKEQTGRVSEPEDGKGLALLSSARPAVICTRSSQSKFQHGGGKAVPESTPNKGPMGCWLPGGRELIFPLGYGHWQVAPFQDKTF